MLLGFDVAKGFAANGYGSHSPGKYDLASRLVAEVVLTMMYLFIIMGSTHGKAPAGFAPIAIGLGLTLIHLISIPITNTSVNPARFKVDPGTVQRISRPFEGGASVGASGRSSPSEPPSALRSWARQEACPVRSRSCRNPRRPFFTCERVRDIWPAQLREDCLQ